MHKCLNLGFQTFYVTLDILASLYCKNFVKLKKLSKNLLVVTLYLHYFFWRKNFVLYIPIILVRRSDEIHLPKKSSMKFIKKMFEKDLKNS
jgi:hypothetical protein